MIRARDKSRLQISDAKVVALSLLNRLVYKLNKMCIVGALDIFSDLDRSYEDEAYIYLFNLIKLIT